MAILKCKMCGGDVELAGDKTFGTCEYCGCTMTFPKVDDEQRAAAFNRGNHFRRIGEFDKALAVYERMVQEDDTDAEAHWCCALCRFGIEYVEDPATMEWLPTCHRASFDSFLEDVDYLAAVKHSAGITQRQYQKDAAKIAEVQRGILATSQNTEAYDVFICYKETDEQGNRTKDSLMAQDIYYQLTEQGRKVFFARITLEDVAGTQYEPYIFAALNSARVMIVVGTTPDNLNAVWVKNEWSRFLSLMKKDHNKLLLPCYRDMDPYDLPEQLSVLQSYDMAKIGFIQDLIRGVTKVLDAEKKAAPTVVKETIVTGGGGNVAPLLKRAFMFLEDGDWSSADDYCEKVLDLDPECGEAYLGKLMVELKAKTREGLKECVLPFDQYNNFQKAIRFGNAQQAEEWQGYITHIQKRNLEQKLNEAMTCMQKANTPEACRDTAQKLAQLRNYQDVEDLIQQCNEKALALEYAQAEQLVKLSTERSLQKAAAKFRQLQDYRDAQERAQQCEQRCLLFVQERVEQTKRKSRLRHRVLSAVALISVLCVLIFAVWIPGATKNRMAIAREKIAPYQHMFAAGDHILVGVNEHGKLYYAVNNQSNSHLLYWASKQMRSVAIGPNYLVGLLENGTVQYAALTNWDYNYNLSFVDTWYDIEAVGVGEHHIVGLKSDGSVVAEGWDSNGECSVLRWKDITAIAVGGYHTVGLCEDGTVEATGSNSSGQCNVNKWKHIAAVAAGPDYTIGVKENGTVVVAGNAPSAISEWKNIVAVAATSDFVVGLQADGTVMIAGGDGHTLSQAVSDWESVVAVAATDDYIVGLTDDGTVLCTDDRFDVSSWDLF